MGNMSYCRFQNTLSDLQDCNDALGDDECSDSTAERRARYRLVKLCRQIADDYTDDDGAPTLPKE